MGVSLCPLCQAYNQQYGDHGDVRDQRDKETKGTKGTKYALSVSFVRGVAIIIVRPFERTVGAMPGTVDKSITQHALQDLLKAGILPWWDARTGHNFLNLHRQPI